MVERVATGCGQLLNRAVSLAGSSLAATGCYHLRHGLFD